MDCHRNVSRQRTLSPVIKKLTVDLFSDPDRIRPRGTDFSKLLTFRGKR